MTVTLSVCKQQSAVIYIHCVTVCVSSGKKPTKMCLFPPLYFLLLRLHVTTQELLNTRHDTLCFWYLLISCTNTLDVSLTVHRR